MSEYGYIKNEDSTMIQFSRTVVMQFLLWMQNDGLIITKWEIGGGQKSLNPVELKDKFFNMLNSTNSDSKPEDKTAQFEIK